MYIYIHRPIYLYLSINIYIYTVSVRSGWPQKLKAWCGPYDVSPYDRWGNLFV